MAPIIVLFAAFIISLLVLRLLRGRFHPAPALRISMACMLLLTAAGHFMFSKGMVLMLPGFIPYRMELVYATGILEVLAAVGLLYPKTQRITGQLLIVFFILILPSNIYAALHHIHLENADHSGPGPGYLWFRIPEQLLFIGWVWAGALRKSGV